MKLLFESYRALLCRCVINRMKATGKMKYSKMENHKPYNTHKYGYKSLFKWAPVFCQANPESTFKSEPKLVCSFEIFSTLIQVNNPNNFVYVIASLFISKYPMKEPGDLKLVYIAHV